MISPPQHHRNFTGIHFRGRLHLLVGLCREQASGPAQHRPTQAQPWAPCCSASPSEGTSTAVRLSVTTLICQNSSGSTDTISTGGPEQPRRQATVVHAPVDGLEASGMFAHQPSLLVSLICFTAADHIANLNKYTKCAKQGKHGKQA